MQNAAKLDYEAHFRVPALREGLPPSPSAKVPRLDPSTRPLQTPSASILRRRRVLPSGGDIRYHKRLVFIDSAGHRAGCLLEGVRAT